MKEQRLVDCLTVLHSKKAVDLYNKNHALFKKCSNEKIQFVFKVVCPEKYKNNLPKEVEVYKYERIPYQGSIDHAYNLHSLLNHIKTEWFCILDPDVYPISDVWDKSVDRLMNKYDIIGMPYSSKRADLIYRDIPALHMVFYKKDIFFNKVKQHGLYDEYAKNWYIFFPIAKKRSLARIAEACSNARVLFSRPGELDPEYHLPDGNKIKNLFDKYIKKYSESKKLPTGDTAWATSMVFENCKVFCFTEHEILQTNSFSDPEPHTTASSLLADAIETDLTAPEPWRLTLQKADASRGFKYSADDEKILFGHMVYGTGGSNGGLEIK